MAQANPALPADLPGVVGTTQRTDGGLQVTYNGMPLYYWAKDQKPGDTTGQNVGGVWFVINPAPASSVMARTDADLGNILVDARGMTLYMYTKDDPSVSNCYDACATAWPPLLTDSDPTGPDAVAAGLGTTTRNDGGVQVTYNGMPLYYWAKDQKPGDTTGQNVGGVWFVVNP
jgi:predicted lipoprotein with Yx(FWY)xxD motif